MTCLLCTTHVTYVTHDVNDKQNVVKKDRALSKVLRVEKGYGAKRMTEFPGRNSSLASVKSG